MESWHQSRVVAHGLVALRKRYIRRARFLTKDREFKKACGKERQAWNRTHKRYTIPTTMHEDGRPAALVRDYPAADIKFESEERARDDLPDELDSTAEHLLYMQEAMERRSRKSTLAAYDDWEIAEWRLADTYFPLEDFPELSDRRNHPARAFLGWAIGSLDLEALGGRVELLIILQLDVGQAITLEDDPLYVLGLFPGITAHDIRDAASEIAERVNRRYSDRLPLARVRALQSEGLTQRAIGDRLGLTERAVKDALALPDDTGTSPP